MIKKLVMLGILACPILLILFLIYGIIDQDEYIVTTMLQSIGGIIALIAVGFVFAVIVCGIGDTTDHEADHEAERERLKKYNDYSKMGSVTGIKNSKLDYDTGVFRMEKRLKNGKKEGLGVLRFKDGTLIGMNMTLYNFENGEYVIPVDEDDRADWDVDENTDECEDDNLQSNT